MSVDARHSPFYAWLDHAAIRALVHAALDLSAGERLVLIKGLVPGLIDAIGDAAFESFLDEMRVKARRARATVGSGVLERDRRSRSEHRRWRDVAGVGRTSAVAAAATIASIAGRTSSQRWGGQESGHDPDGDWRRYCHCPANAD